VNYLSNTSSPWIYNFNLVQQLLNWKLIWMILKTTNFNLILGWSCQQQHKTTKILLRHFVSRKKNWIKRKKLNSSKKLINNRNIQVWSHWKMLRVGVKVHRKTVKHVNLTILLKWRNSSYSKLLKLKIRILWVVIRLHPKVWRLKLKTS
jgi:hypothetical protein